MGVRPVYKLSRHQTLLSHMDELTRLIKDLKKLLQTITKEDRYEILEGVDINEIKEELGTWFIADYPLYQGS